MKIKEVKTNKNQVETNEKIVITFKIEYETDYPYNYPYDYLITATME